MALTLASKMINVFALGDLFDGKEFQVVEMDGKKYTSIIDIISGISETSHPATTWKRIKEQRDDIRSEYKTYRFGTRGQATPVADAELVLKIIFEIPGRKADLFRNTAAFTFLQIMEPSLEFIETLRDRLDEMESGGRDASGGFLVPAKRLTTASRVIKETHFYIRICMPEEYMSSSTHPKLVTQNVIKPGITYDINDRHSRYENDNGFPAMAFLCKTRQDAVNVENIIKDAYREIALYGSREYLSTTALAKMLHVEYDSASYESYVSVAQALYVRVVTLLHRIWPEKYAGQYGSTYGLVEKARRGTRAAEASTSREVDLELEFVRNEITPKIAKEMGFVIEEPVLTHVPALPLQTPTPQTSPHAAGAMRPPTVAMTRKVVERINGPIISRNLKNCEEVLYENIIDAATATGIGRQSLNRTYLNKARQLLGRHWRTPGTQYWTVTKKFDYDASYVETAAVAYIKATDSAGEITVYESRNAARHILKLTASQIQMLTKAIGDGNTFMGSLWSNVHESEASLYGTWHEDDGDHTEALRTWRNSARTGQSLRCDGIIIGFNLAEQKDIEYSSISSAAQRYRIHHDTIRDTLLDKPVQGKGQVFRTLGSTRRWQPSELFKFNENVVVKRNTKYIVAEDADHVPVGLYQGAPSAAEREQLDATVITARLDKDVAYGGLTWRTARPKEYETWIPVAPRTP